ncbi:hypothetical protein V2J09_022024 [Rumex salicifolius]
MGKKVKITGDVVVMEVPQTALGVRTRAKTLALQQNPDLCFLQLRSRRLEKPQFPPPSPKNPSNRGTSGSHGSKPAQAGSKFCAGPFSSSPALSASRSRSNKGTSEEEEGARYGTDVDDLSVEASFGENSFDFDLNGRSTWESTPCSIIRDFDNNRTPGSAVRPTCSRAACRRQSRNSVQRRNNHYTHEMEEFFAVTEMQQQQHFMNKYNFDIVNDLPLSGRYDWVRIDF